MYKRQGQSDNISFHSASVMTTWRCNQTDDWLRKLTSTQRDLLISDASRLGRGLKQTADAREVQSAKYRLMMLQQTSRNLREKCKNKIHGYLELQEVPLHKTIVEFNSMNAERSPAQITKAIKVQVRALVTLCGNSRSDLMSFSVAGQPFTHDVVKATYVSMLRRLKPTDFVKLDLLQVMFKDPHTCRGGSEFKHKVKVKDLSLIHI